MRFGKLLAAASEYLDANIRAEGPMHLMRIRVDKLVEEVGEIQEAIIGIEGSNPRKGRTHTLADLEAELLDVALTAMLAFCHVSAMDDGADVVFESHCRLKISRYYGIE